MPEKSNVDRICSVRKISATILVVVVVVEAAEATAAPAPAPVYNKFAVASSKEI
jgi:hypothetical protein